jgi:hypothetical protein
MEMERSFSKTINSGSRDFKAEIAELSIVQRRLTMLSETF